LVQTIAAKAFYSLLRREAAAAESAARPVPKSTTVIGSGIGTGSGVGGGVVGGGGSVGGGVSVITTGPSPWAKATLGASVIAKERAKTNTSAINTILGIVDCIFIRTISPCL
jgi:hypothetical protein